LRKILIRGGGVSGLTAAIKLAIADFDVTIQEKRIDFKGTRHTSVLRNYSISARDAMEELKKVGIKIIPEHKICNVIKVSPNYCSMVNGKTIYYSFNRGNFTNSLEQQLILMAKRYGVKFEFGNKSNLKNADIVATGYKNPNIRGYGKVYYNVNIDKKTVYLFYNNEIAPFGYLCVIPSINNNTTVLLVVFSSLINFNMIRILFNKAIKKNKILNFLLKNAVKGNTIIGSSSYQKNPYNNCKKNNKLYIGEAGGFQDASRGFGIRYAILSGVFAAESIIQDVDFPKIIKEYFKEEFDENYRRRMIFNSFENKDYDVMIKDLGESTTIEKYLAYCNENLV
jgi:flavin-dependent dehydrogenase